MGNSVVSMGKESSKLKGRTTTAASHRSSSSINNFHPATVGQSLPMSHISGNTNPALLVSANATMATSIATVHPINGVQRINSQNALSVHDRDDI